MQAKSIIAELAREFKNTLDRCFSYGLDHTSGMVLYCWINNAFYVCAKENRSAIDKKVKENEAGCKPIFIYRTSSFKSLSADRYLGVKISKKDYRTGIPPKIKDKIFQPFFTTKPTVSGTGLGLSLSYDIVKANGGEIKVESKEGEGTEFIITIPVKS